MPEALITGASSAGAYKIKRLLGIQDVLLADHQELSSIPNFIKIPEGNSPHFVHTLLNICLDQSVQTIYPLRSLELLPLSEAFQLFSEYCIDIMVPSIQRIHSFEMGKKDNGRLVIIKDGKVLSGDFYDQLLQLRNGIFIISDSEQTMSLYTVD